MNLQEGIDAAVENTESMAALPLPTGLAKRIREWLNGSDETDIVTYRSDRFGTTFIVTKKLDEIDGVKYNAYRFFPMSNSYWEVSQDVSNSNADDMLHTLLNETDIN